MIRGFAAALLSHFADPDTRPVYFVEAEFGSGTVRYCQMPYDIPWGGETWIGAGRLLSVGRIEENASPDSVTHRVTLSGLDPTTMAQAMQENPAWRWLTVYLGAQNNGQLVSDPYPVMAGLMSKVSVREEGADAAGGTPWWLGGTITYQITVESESVRQSRIAGAVRSDRQHQERFPGDTFHRFQAALVDNTGVSPGPGYEQRKLYD